MNSSVHDDNKKTGIFFLCKGSTQGLDGTTLTAEKRYSVSFTAIKKKLCLNLHYNEANSSLFVYGTEIIKYKAKGSDIAAIPLCLGIISEDFSKYNMTKNWID